MGGRPLPPDWSSSICAERVVQPGARDAIRSASLRLFARLSNPWWAASKNYRPAAIRRVLFIRPDHLGDILFTSPALERWHRGAPAGVETILSVGPWSSDLAAHIGAGDEIEAFPYPGFTRRAKGAWWEPYRALLRQARRLRARQIDMAVILRFDHWWGGLLAYLAGIPVRVGYNTDPLSAFLTKPVPYTGVGHEVERNLTLVQAALLACGERSAVPTGDFPALAYHVRPEERQRAVRLLADAGVPGDAPLVALAPGAGASVKLWPAERFAELGDILIRRWGVAVVLIGGPAEVSLAWKVAAHMKEEALVAAGRTDLGTLAALFERSRLVIGADSGPLHLAVAAGAPTIHLYGPADPVLFGPWTDRPAQHRVLVTDCHCAPCNRLDYGAAELRHHRCMERITVERVVSAVESMVEAGDIRFNDG
jgi:lipopolysaccharide heptosyltransferase II